MWALSIRNTERRRGAGKYAASMSEQSDTGIPDPNPETSSTVAPEDRLGASAAGRLAIGGTLGGALGGAFDDPVTDEVTAGRAIEAILMVADEPVTAQLLGELLEVSPAAIEELCAAMATQYEAEDRGFQLVQVAGGYRFQSSPKYATYVERFVLDGQAARLSAAALETLAIVAYKQPISRAQVTQIRGVNVDGVMKTLVQRGYVAELGQDTGPGQAMLFGTTNLFLQNLGLNTLDQLPPLGDLVPGAEVMEALESSLRIDDQTGRPIRSSNRTVGDTPDPAEQDSDTDPVSVASPSGGGSAGADSTNQSGRSGGGDPHSQQQLLEEEPNMDMRSDGSDDQPFELDGEDL
jgi:segregation and condensation protein B